MKLKIKEQKNPRTGKPVTAIMGLTHNPEVIENIEKKLKSSCGAGGYTDKKTIFIQGSHTAKIKSVLEKNGYTVST